jgi:hypothetical protein
MTATPASDALRADHRGVEMCLDRLLFAAKHPITDLARRVREGFLEIRRLARLPQRGKRLLSLSAGLAGRCADPDATINMAHP